MPPEIVNVIVDTPTADATASKSRTSEPVTPLEKKKRGKRKKKPTPAHPDLLGQRLFLRVREFSDLTGTPIPTCYALMNAGKIPVVVIGNSKRIPVSAVKELAV